MDRAVSSSADHVLLVMAGRQPHIPEGEEQEAHRQDRGQKIVSHQDCQRAAKAEQRTGWLHRSWKSGFPRPSWPGSS